MVDFVYSPPIPDYIILSGPQQPPLGILTSQFALFRNTTTQQDFFCDNATWIPVLPNGSISHPVNSAIQLTDKAELVRPREENEPDTFIWHPNGPPHRLLWAHRFHIDNLHCVDRFRSLWFTLPARLCFRSPASPGRRQYLRFFRLLSDLRASETQVKSSPQFEIWTSGSILPATSSLDCERWIRSIPSSDCYAQLRSQVDTRGEYLTTNDFIANFKHSQFAIHEQSTRPLAIVGIEVYKLERLNWRMPVSHSQTRVFKRDQLWDAVDVRLVACMPGVGTDPHLDDDLAGQIIRHISGSKIWFFWTATPQTTEHLRLHRAILNTLVFEGDWEAALEFMGHSSPNFSWLLAETPGLTFEMPPGILHAVITLEPALHLAWPVYQAKNFSSAVQLCQCNVDALKWAFEESKKPLQNHVTLEELKASVNISDLRDNMCEWWEALETLFSDPTERRKAKKEVKNLALSLQEVVERIPYTWSDGVNPAWNQILESV